MRLGLASVSPSATQTRASWASKSLLGQELDGVGRHHRQLQLGRQRHGGLTNASCPADRRAAAPGKAAGEERRQLASRLAGPHRVALRQRLTHGAVVRAERQIRPSIQLGQPPSFKQA